MDFIEWDRTLAQQWIDRASPRVNVAQHNSAVALSASILDLFAQPATIVPLGAERAQYPKTLYHGSIADADGREVPLVGSLELTADARAAEARGEVPLYPHQSLREELLEALRRVSVVDYQEASGTAPAGDLGEVYPHGVVAVTGPAAAALILNLEPSKFVTEPAAGNQLAAILTAAVPVARAITQASRLGSSINEAGTTALAALTNRANPGVSWRDWRNHGKNARMWAAGTLGAFVLGFGIAAAVRRKPVNYTAAINPGA